MDRINSNLSPQHHIKHHHEDKAKGEADGAKVGVLALTGFGNELFYHHIHHGTSGKGQHIRENGCHQRS